MTTNTITKLEAHGKCRPPPRPNAFFRMLKKVHKLFLDLPLDPDPFPNVTSSSMAQIFLVIFV